MPRSILIREATVCGVCSHAVFLMTGAGCHALVEEDCHGEKVPHVCPTSSVTDWLRHNQTNRMARALARGARIEIDQDGTER